VNKLNHYVVFLEMKSEELSAKYRAEHLVYLENLAKEGKLFAYGRFTDGWGGMVIYYGNSKEEVEALVQQDPFIIHDARTYLIREWAATECK
jgi:uncharacterized protein YciI